MMMVSRWISFENEWPDHFGKGCHSDDFYDSSDAVIELFGCGGVVKLIEVSAK